MAARTKKSFDAPDAQADGLRSRVTFALAYGAEGAGRLLLPLIIPNDDGGRAQELREPEAVLEGDAWS